MKNIAAFCFAVVFATTVHAQLAVAVPDAPAKPKPVEPVLERDHRGLGRIGVTLTFSKDGPPLIATMVRGGPAADAGFKVGDAIIRIDKNDTSTLTNDEVDMALRGEPGTGVELTLRRGDETHYIVRAVSRRPNPAHPVNVIDTAALPSSPELPPPPPTP